MPKPIKPSKVEIVRSLRDEVRMWRRSYRERDGKIHCPVALRKIATLEEAMKILSQ